MYYHPMFQFGYPMPQPGMMQPGMMMAPMPPGMAPPPGVSAPPTASPAAESSSSSKGKRRAAPTEEGGDMNARVGKRKASGKDQPNGNVDTGVSGEVSHGSAGDS